jgi:hypothetical protein
MSATETASRPIARQSSRWSRSRCPRRVAPRLLSSLRWREADERLGDVSIPPAADVGRALPGERERPARGELTIADCRGDKKRVPILHSAGPLGLRVRPERLRRDARLQVELLCCGAPPKPSSLPSGSR